jgi:hypothetical protein
MNNEEIRTITRAAEINALSIARTGKPTCLECGLFATVTLVIENPYVGEEVNALEYYYVRPGEQGVRFDPHFCEDCQPRESERKSHWKFEPVEGAPVARRLNRLLHELAGTVRGPSDHV